MQTNKKGSVYSLKWIGVIHIQWCMHFSSNWKYQFSRKWIFADFIVLWPTKKYIFPFSFPCQKISNVFLNIKTNSEWCIPFLKQTKNNSKSCILSSFIWRKHKRNSKWWIPFSFFWRKHKAMRLRKHTGNPEWWFLLSFYRTKTKQNRKLDSFTCTLQVASLPGSTVYHCHRIYSWRTKHSEISLSCTCTQCGPMCVSNSTQ